MPTRLIERGRWHDYVRTAWIGIRSHFADALFKLSILRLKLSILRLKLSILRLKLSILRLKLSILRLKLSNSPLEAEQLPPESYRVLHGAGLLPLARLLSSLFLSHVQHRTFVHVGNRLRLATRSMTDPLIRVGEVMGTISLGRMVRPYRPPIAPICISDPT